MDLVSTGIKIGLFSSFNAFGSAICQYNKPFVAGVASVVGAITAEGVKKVVDVSLLNFEVNAATVINKLATPFGHSMPSGVLVEVVLIEAAKTIGSIVGVGVGFVAGKMFAEKITGKSLSAKNAFLISAASGVATFAVMNAVGL